MEVKMAIMLPSAACWGFGGIMEAYFDFLDPQQLIWCRRLNRMAKKIAKEAAMKVVCRYYTGWYLRRFPARDDEVSTFVPDGGWLPGEIPQAHFLERIAAMGWKAEKLEIIDEDEEEGEEEEEPAASEPGDEGQPVVPVHWEEAQITTCFYMDEPLYIGIF